MQKGGSSELRIFLLNDLKEGCHRGIKGISFNGPDEIESSPLREIKHTQIESRSVCPTLGISVFVRTYCVDVLVSSKGIGAAYVGKGD